MHREDGDSCDRRDPPFYESPSLELGLVSQPGGGVGSAVSEPTLVAEVSDPVLTRTTGWVV